MGSLWNVTFFANIPSSSRIVTFRHSKVVFNNVAETTVRKLTSVPQERYFVHVKKFPSRYNYWMFAVSTAFQPFTGGCWYLNTASFEILKFPWRTSRANSQNPEKRCLDMWHHLTSHPVIFYVFSTTKYILAIYLYILAILGHMRKLKVVVWNAAAY